jgi:serine phosphatase RsbU (regulator of sigma subunit)/PAS domain-containing protein
MESITGRRPLLNALPRGLARADWWGLVIGTAMLAAVVAIDVSQGRSDAIVAVFVIAPFVPAALGSVFATVVIGVLTIVAALVSGSWDMNFGAAGYWIRSAEVVVGAAFALVAAVARDRARISSHRLAVLDSVGAIADGSLPLAETIERVTEGIVPVAADMCMIDAIHEGRVTRAAVRVHGRPNAAEIEERLRRRHPSVPTRFVAGERAWMRIAHFRRRLDAEDLRRMAEGPEDLRFLEGLQPRSLITAAMTARGRSLGTLTLVTAWSKRQYTTDDVRFAQVLANRIALALDNAGLFSDLESVERRLDAVMSLLDEAVLVHGPSGDLLYGNEAAARWLDFESTQAMLEAGREDIFARFRMWTEGGELLDAERIASRISAGVLPRRVLVRLELIGGQDERWVRLSSEPIRGPDGRLLYAVTTAEDVTELKRSEFAQQLLARTGELLASSIDYRETLRAVPQIAVPRFADWCSVNVPSPDGRLEQVAIAHTDPGKLGLVSELRERYPVFVDEPGGIGEVARTGQPLFMPEISRQTLAAGARDPEHLRLLEAVDMGSALAVPMTAGAKALGVMVFVNDRGSRAFDRDDLAIAVEIGRRAGLAAENARLAEEQATVAHVLQRGLRPPELPDMRGFRLATMYRPAGEVNEVGGDFYDAFQIDGGWMMVVGDVTGRGAAAASLTALARYTIRTAGMLTGNPSLAASIVDESLKRLHDLALCSAVILVIPESEAHLASLSLIVAGHPLPLLVHDGSVTAVGRTGPLLGAPGKPDWTASSVELAPGDQLVLYTDGVTEACGANGRFGEERLRQTIASEPNPGSMVASLESALASFAAGAPEDDAAVLALMRSAGGGEVDSSNGAAARTAAASEAG